MHSYRDAFDLCETDLVVATVVEACGARTHAGRRLSDANRPFEV